MTSYEEESCTRLQQVIEGELLEFLERSETKLSESTLALLMSQFLMTQQMVQYKNMYVENEVLLTALVLKAFSSCLNCPMALPPSKTYFYPLRFYLEWHKRKKFYL